VTETFESSGGKREKGRESRGVNWMGWVGGVINENENFFLTVQDSLWQRLVAIGVANHISIHFWLLNLGNLNILLL
jgi:hypothetical protein